MQNNLGSIENPVKCENPSGEIKYLDQLAGPKGERIFYKRLGSKKSQVDKNDFVLHIVTNMKRYNYIVRQKSEIEHNTDKVVSKQLLIHLENFFKKGRTKNTRKQKTNIKSKATRKKNMFI